MLGVHVKLISHYCQQFSHKNNTMNQCTRTLLQYGNSMCRLVRFVMNFLTIILELADFFIKGASIAITPLMCIIQHYTTNNFGATYIRCRAESTQAIYYLHNKKTSLFQNILLSYYLVLNNSIEMQLKKLAPLCINI